MNEKFTKELVDQVAVQWYARQLGYNELAALTKAEYFKLLGAYGALIDEYGIDVG